jgi:hypothetical protein
MRMEVGMNGNWWSVVGQGFDLVGFTILSLDLYRDYSRYKRRDDYRFAVLAYEQAKQTKARIGDAEEPPPDGSVSLRQKQFHELKASTSANLIKQLYLELTKIDKKSADAVSIDEMAAVVQGAAYQPLRELDKRPPVAIAIGSVLIGFGFQIVGSWPD